MLVAPMLAPAAHCPRFGGGSLAILRAAEPGTYSLTTMLLSAHCSCGCAAGGWGWAAGGWGWAAGGWAVTGGRAQKPTSSTRAVDPASRAYSYGDEANACE